MYANYSKKCSTIKWLEGIKIQILKRWGFACHIKWQVSVSWRMCRRIECIITKLNGMCSSLKKLLTNFPHKKYPVFERCLKFQGHNIMFLWTLVCCGSYPLQFPYFLAFFLPWVFSGKCALNMNKFRLLYMVDLCPPVDQAG